MVVWVCHIYLHTRICSNFHKLQESFKLMFIIALISLLTICNSERVAALEQQTPPASHTRHNFRTQSSSEKQCTHPV